MTDNKPNPWASESKIIKATQVAFDISTDAQVFLKKAAVDNGITPSDQMRQVLGLSVKKPKRPRLTVSLTPQDYVILAEKYGLEASDKLGIKEKAVAEILEFVDKHND